MAEQLDNAWSSGNRYGAIKLTFYNAARPRIDAQRYPGGPPVRPIQIDRFIGPGMSLGKRKIIGIARVPKFVEFVDNINVFVKPVRYSGKEQYDEEVLGP